MMITSILLDHCDVDENASEQEASINLVESVILKNFREDLIALSKDKVVNTRLELALAFNKLHDKYEQLEQEAVKR